MDADGNLGVLRGLHHHRADLGERGNLLVQLSMRNDDGDVQLFRRGKHGVDALQIRSVESAHGAFLFFGKGKDLFQINKHVFSPHISGRTAL